MKNKQFDQVSDLESSKLIWLGSSLQSEEKLIFHLSFFCQHLKFNIKVLGQNSRLFDRATMMTTSMMAIVCSDEYYDEQMSSLC